MFSTLGKEVSGQTVATSLSVHAVSSEACLIFFLQSE